MVPNILRTHRLTYKNSCVTETTWYRIRGTRSRRRCRMWNIPRRGGAWLSSFLQHRPTSLRQILLGTCEKKPTPKSRNKNKQWLTSDLEWKFWTKKSDQVDDPMWWRVEWEAGVGSWHTWTSLDRVAAGPIGTSDLLSCPSYAKVNLVSKLIWHPFSTYIHIYKYTIFKKKSLYV